MGKITPACAAVLVLIFAVHDRPSYAQAGGTRVVTTNTSPRLREIGAAYFDTTKQSQVWVNVETGLPKPDPVPVLLNFTVMFAGRELRHAPAAVQVRAQAIATAFPFQVRQPILRFMVTDTMTLDLTAAGSAYRFFASSNEGPADTVIADMPFESLRRLTQAADGKVDALGFSAHLGTADRAALREFVRTMDGGVVVRPQWPL
jgi:hypothetical protein